MEKRSQRLRQFVLTQIKGRGPVPSFQFMDWCLYHPEYGYCRLKHLIEPEAGMGEIFKVLIQHKGVPQPPLDGLRELKAVPRPSLGEGEVDWQHP